MYWLRCFCTLCSKIRFVRAIFQLLLIPTVALTQTSQPNTKPSDQNPPVKVNILNVCTPRAEEQKELSAAMSRLPKAPVFAKDFEISRGVSTIEEGKNSKYLRFLREFKSDSPLATIQYSLSADPANTIETLVFRGREVKDLLALSIEDKLSTSASKPSTVIQSDTPASRVRVERAGKTTVGLARCEGVDQSKYEPIFAQASTVLADYRRWLRLKTMLASDMAWLSAASATGSRSGRQTSPNTASSPAQSTPH